MAHLINKEYLNFSDVLIRPFDSVSYIESRNDVDITIPFLNDNNIPIIVANMDHTGTIEMALALQKYNIIVALHKFYTAEQLIKAFGVGGLAPYHFISIGESESDLNKYREVINQLGFTIPLMIDVANGYRASFIKFLQNIRNEFPEIYIAAGNVCTPNIISHYADAGVNAVKIGIGPGGQCRTRETAGVGVPQLSALLECNEYIEINNLNIDTIADGGVNDYADFAKALATGSKFVMSGSFFGGHDECSGEVFVRGGENFMVIYGMSSQSAQKKHYGDIKEYRASEGRTSIIPHKGPVSNTVSEILGSLRSTLTYVGIRNIQNLPSATSFIRVNDTINRKYEKNTVGI